MRWFSKVNYKKLEKDLKKEFKEQQEVVQESKEIEETKSLYEQGMEKLKNNEEMWVKVKDNELYNVSNFGRIMNVKTGEEIVPHTIGINRDTYAVTLRQDNLSVTTSVAKIVSQSFEIPNPRGTKICYHKGDSLDNRLDNLTFDRNYNPACRKKNERKSIEDDVEYNDKDRIDKELAKNQSKITVKEIWKDVVGYERWYEVSDKGNVRRIERDGTTNLLKSKSDDTGRLGRIVNLKTTGSFKHHLISHLVAEAFGLKPIKDNSKFIYHIDGDINNDCFSNLTYDIKETEEYIEKQKQQEEFKTFVENNKEFLVQARNNKEVTIKDVYDKLCEILEVLKNDNR